MKIGVLLSGCGVYDGAEIQEAVLTLLAIDELGAEAVCIGINEPQFHVINHLTGEEMSEQRNTLVEAARIARGEIVDISMVQPADIDALVIPGGFGSAKNFTNWAFEGPDGSIHKSIKLLIVNLVNIGKPIVALCVSPIVVAKALEGSSIQPSMTIGTTAAESPYDIASFISGLEKTGVKGEMKTIDEVHIDRSNRIITAPCYMMNASIKEVNKNIRLALDALNQMVNEKAE